MKRPDHKSLGRFLLERTSLLPESARAKAFLLGCCAPDSIPLTYLRGFHKSGSMRGHHAAYSHGHIRRRLDRVRRRGVRSVTDWFFLGTLLHYVADSFTFSHTERFSGKRRLHDGYEARLHPVYQAYLSKAPLTEFCATDPLSEFYRRARETYEATTPSMETDCRFVTGVCAALFDAITQNSGKKQNRH